jgi:flagellar biogenesis protein FliO
MSRAFPILSARPAGVLEFLGFFSQGHVAAVARTRFGIAGSVLLTGANLMGQATSSPAAVAPAIPDAAASLVRVTGALVLVLGLFLCGAWLFKNWRRLAVQRGTHPKLSILETRSLGARQAVFVIGYEQQRFLVAASPAGVNLLSHLPDAATAEAESAAKPGSSMSFAQALTQVLKGK